MVGVLAFIEIDDLLFGFEDACVMDIKMGTRTFLEKEVTKSTPRTDLYAKVFYLGLLHSTCLLSILFIVHHLNYWWLFRLYLIILYVYDYQIYTTKNRNSKWFTFNTNLNIHFSLWNLWIFFCKNHIISYILMYIQMWDHCFVLNLILQLPNQEEMSGFIWISLSSSLVIHYCIEKQCANLSEFSFLSLFIFLHSPPEKLLYYCIEIHSFHISP